MATERLKRPRKSMGARDLVPAFIAAMLAPFCLVLIVPAEFAVWSLSRGVTPMLAHDLSLGIGIALLAYPFMLFIGLPFYFLLRYCNAVSIWSAAAAGLITAWSFFPIANFISAYLLAGTSLASSPGYVRPSWAALFDPSLVLNPFTPLGAVVGVVFWLVVRSLTPASRSN